MNILQIVSASRTGGVERHVVVLSDLLRQRGHRVTTLCPPGDWLPSQLREVGLPVQEIAMHGFPSYKVARALPQYVRDNKFDLIHSHLTRATYYAFLMGRLTRLPVVSSVHVLTHDFVYRHLFPKPGNQIITVSECLRDAMLRQGIPAARVRTIHNGTNFFPPDPRPVHSVENLLKEENLKEEKAEQIVHAGRGGAVRLLPNVTEDAQEDFSAEAFGAETFDTEKFGSEEFDPYRRQSRPRPESLTVHSEWSVPQDAELVGLFARMEEFKGPFILTQAVRKIVAARPRAYFFFVGPIEAEMQQALWEIADRDGIVDRLRFTGGRNDVQRLMAAMDVITLPSRYEACSMAIIEAMMLGKPVVATRAGGNPELIKDGETGLLIERNPDALANAIIRLLADPLGKLQMGEAARRRAITRFSASVMVNHIEALYQEMVETRPFA